MGKIIQLNRDYKDRYGLLVSDTQPYITMIYALHVGVVEIRIMSHIIRDFS